MNRSVIETKVESFFSQFDLHIYKKNGIIIHPEKKLLGAYYVKKGFIREYCISTNGTEITIHIFTPNSFFPMTWIIAAIKNRYYYEALTDIELYSAPKDKVLQFLKENPDVHFDLSKRILFGLDKLTHRIEHMLTAQANQKIITVLLYLARKFGQQLGNSIVITNKFTHQEIASLAGMSRETASRELEKLEKHHLITSKDSTILIEDIAKLNEAM